MLRALFSRQAKSITSAAFVVAVFSVLSRFIGFIRDRILAGQFGAGDTLDVYFAAFRVPDLLFQLIVTGALSASFIPLFTKYYAKGKEKDAWKMTNNLLHIVLFSFILLSIIVMIFAPQGAALIAPGFNVEKQMAVADLMRIMFLAQVLLSVSMVFGSVLQGAKRFLSYAIAPVFYNIGIIIGALVFVPYFGLTGLGYGVILGALLHLLTQTIGVFMIGYSYMPIFDIKHPDVRYTVKHMLPRILGLAVNQLNFLGMTILASLLAAGSVTILQFAYNLNFFPIGVFAVSYAVAAFPVFCELAQAQKWKKFTENFSLTVRQIMFFVIPAISGFIILRAQIVRLVLGAGDFDWEATILTADTLALFAISFLFQSIVFVLVRGFFALDDTKTPFLVGLISASINIGVAVLLIPHFSVMAFGIAFSLSAAIQCLLLWLLLRLRVGNLGEWSILQSAVILSVSGLVSAAAMQWVKTLIGHLVSLDRFVNVLLQGGVAGGIGILTYLFVAFLLKSPELGLFFSSVKRRLVKKAVVEEEFVTSITQG